jgi:hypothetical protein
MSPTRRDFIKGVGATAALAMYSRDLLAETIALSPSGRVLETRFKGLPISCWRREARRLHATPMCASR